MCVCRHMGRMLLVFVLNMFKHIHVVYAVHMHICFRCVVGHCWLHYYCVHLYINVCVVLASIQDVQE